MNISSPRVMFVVSGLNTVFCSASSVMVIIAATGEESPPEAEDGVVATVEGKINPIIFPPIINAAIKKPTTETNNERRITVFFEDLLSISDL
jgi:hypothetical protein